VSDQDESAADLGEGEALVAARNAFGLILVVMAMAALSAPAAQARGNLLGLNPQCGPTSKPFARFGDYRNYTFGANGGLELGSFGWTLSGGAAVVAGNESYYAHSRYDSHSLFLPEGSSATTPSMCMGTFSTWVRFFASNKDSGALRVQVQYRSLVGTLLGLVDAGTVSGGSGWTPSPAFLNLQSLNCLVGAGTLQLKLTPVGGSFQVDDFYVDPLASSD
jgi:hypothetical protein